MKSFDLDQPLIELVSQYERGCWTIRHAFEGVQIFGGIGSGKTSGSGRMLAMKYLTAGFGGLVLTVKPDEKELWQQYCRLTGREHDLLILEPGGPYRFNFLQFETRQSSTSSTENLVEVLKTVIRAGEQHDAGRADDSFWETALDMLIFHVIDLCQLAYRDVSIQQLYDIVQSIPKNEEGMAATGDEKAKAFQRAFEAARLRINAQIETWFASLPTAHQAALQDDSVFEDTLTNALPDARLLKFLDQFFFGTFITLSEKTRSIIDFTFSGFLFRLLRDPVYSLFCRYDSNLTPEDSLDRKSVV